MIDSKDPSVSFSHGCNRGEKVKNSNECTIQCPSAQPPAITSATIVCENGVWVDKHDSINVYHNTDDLKVPFIACPLSETLYIFNSCQYIQYSAESYDIDFCSYYQSEEINSVYCLYKCKKGFVLANEPKKRHVGANNSVFGVIYCIANAFEEPACQPFEHVNTCSPLVSKNVELVNCEMDGGLRCEVYCPLGSFEGLDKDRVNVLCHEGVWRQEQAKGMFLVIRSAGNVFVCKDRKEILTIEQENVAEVGGEYAKEKCQFWCLKGYFAYPPDFSQDFYTGGVAKYGEKKECLRWTEWLVKMQKEYVFREDKI